VTTGILLLAAGSSRRFGDDKRLTPMPDGRTLLDATLHILMTTGLPLLVCLGPGDLTLSTQLQTRDIPSRLCPRAGEGMGSTLADGVAALPTWDTVLIALADMPWIRHQTFLAVAAATGPGQICIPTHLGRRGHPVGFSSHFYPDLARLTGDIGARKVILGNTDKIRELDVDDPGIHRDVDYPRDVV
jgi:molybdenum cofactor cytidylyltransferase